mmetsp:Transcript_138690/g.196386  ORF Transcript_138690/g.196386 Transcript_138690/m.196386 type:complete len:146 (+) Transcript_138690:28-465(+)
MAEFSDVGRHCSLKECNQRDFLPCVCLACKDVFCAEHQTYDGHSCPEQPKAAKVPICPLCSSPVAMAPGGNPDEVIDEHISRGCAKEKKPRCVGKKCRESVLLLSCADCGANVCVRHRLGRLHNCPGPTSASRQAANQRKLISVH